MKSNYTKMIVTENGEEIVPMTADEIAIYDNDVETASAQKKASDEAEIKKASDRNVLLEKLGISSDEAKLLLS